MCIKVPHKEGVGIRWYVFTSLVEEVKGVGVGGFKI